jgi:polysaccharide chain length determinant protein (PEP-CTERM system associated)
MSKLIQAYGKQPPQLAAAGKPQFSPHSILRGLWKHRRLIAVVWVMTTVAVIAMVMQLPRTYSAEAVILVESKGIPESLVQPMVSSQLQDRLEQLKQRVLSYDRLTRVIEQFGLYPKERKSIPMEEVIRQMKEDINMKLDRGWGSERPNTFRIAYQSADPVTTARVANHIGKFFVDENLRDRAGQATVAAEFLANQLAEAKRNMEVQEARLNQYKTQYMGELPQQEQALLASLSQAKTQLSGIQDGLNRAQQNKLIVANTLELAKSAEATTRRIAEQLAANRAAAAQAATQAILSGGGRTPSAVLPPRPSEAQRVAEQIEQLRQRYGEQHPELRRLLAHYRELKEAEARQVAAAPPPPTETAEAAPAPMQLPVLIQPDMGGRDLTTLLMEQRERIELLKTQQTVGVSEIGNLEKERRRIIEEIATLEARILKLPMREQQITSVMRDYDVAKANYQAMLEKKLAADLAADMERRQKGESFVMLDPARIPEIPEKPNRRLLASAGAILGLLLGAIVALGIEMKKDVFLGEWELPPGVPVLGRVVQIHTVSHSPSHPRIA